MLVYHLFFVEGHVGRMEIATPHSTSMHETHTHHQKAIQNIIFYFKIIFFFACIVWCMTFTKKEIKEYLALQLLSSYRIRFWNIWLYIVQNIFRILIIESRDLRHLKNRRPVYGTNLLSSWVSHAHAWFHGHEILKTRAHLLMVFHAMPFDLQSMCIIRVSIVNLRFALKFDTYKN